MPTGTTRLAQVRHERLVRRFALRGLLFLSIAELVALALRGTQVLVPG